jgi:hypothetical protein
MIKQNDTFLLPIWKLLLPFNVQIFSQNQIQYRVISNGKEKRANSAFITLFNEELPAGEYIVEFNTSPFLRNLFISIKSLSYKRWG